MALRRRLPVSGASTSGLAWPPLDVLDQLDLGLLEEAVELLDVGLVEVDLRDRVGDLRVEQHALLLTLGHETLDLL